MIAHLRHPRYSGPIARWGHILRQKGQSPADFPEVYQASHYPPLEWPVVAMEKHFSSGTRTGPHDHDRGQLMFAKQGFVVATTSVGTWFVPRAHALWIPPYIVHDVSMHSDVLMLAAYVERSRSAGLGEQARVMKVGKLLEEMLNEVAEETRLCRRSDRTDHLTWLVLDEIERAPATEFVLPLPHDSRIARVTQALIADPGSERTIDQWCDMAGLSRRTMTRTFRQETGLSFGDWRRRLRLIVAMTRVAEGEPLARVAATLAYRNLPAFRAMAARYAVTESLAPYRDAEATPDPKHA